jgi:hypothetical protein
MGRYYFWLRLKAALCLCGGFLLAIIHHTVTESTEVPQRKIRTNQHEEMFVRVISCIFVDRSIYS